jgi:hypothetical protein
MFFRADPNNVDGFLAIVQERSCVDESMEIIGCVDKDARKHKKKRSNGKSTTRPAINERYRKDYVAPPTSLFREYCGCLASR